MPLSTKLQAEYTELINQYLDTIPVEKPEDFVEIKEALQAITDPTQSHHIAPTLEGRIKDIKEVLEQPELYVAKTDDYQEFTSIVMRRIAAKVSEINNLSPSEKEKIISEQNEIKERALQNQALMASRSPPAVGSEAHVVSEIEWLRQLQQTSPQLQERGQALLNQIQAIYRNTDEFNRQLEDEIRQRTAALQLRLQAASTSDNTLSLGDMFAMQLEMNNISQLDTLRLAVRPTPLMVLMRSIR